MGISASRKIQLGRESTAGTAVAATTIWRGPGAAFSGLPERVMVNEDIGYLVQTDRGYFPNLSSELAFPETELTYEQILHICEAAFHTEASITANGGTSNAYIYNYLPSTTSQLTLKTYTLEAGDNAQAYEQEYSFVREFSISGAPNDALKLSSTWQGRQRTKTSFTGSLSVPTVYEVLFNKGKLYIDDGGGTIGTTQMTNTWLGFDLSVTTGWKAQFTGDGNLYFSFIKNTGPQITGSITLEYDTAGINEEDVYAAGTTRLIRMAFDGPSTGFTGTGGTYTARKLMMDFAAQITSVDPLENMDGNDVVKINWTAVYNTTWTKMAEFTICNLLSAVP